MKPTIEMLNGMRDKMKEYREKHDALKKKLEDLEYEIGKSQNEWTHVSSLCKAAFSAYMHDFDLSPQEEDAINEVLGYMTNVTVLDPSDEIPF